jgi:general secretion pathway protein M
MNAWWQNLPPRERRLVIGGAILIGLTILWLFIWKPLANRHQLLQQDLQDAQATYLQMQQQRTAILAAQGKSGTQPANTGGSLHGNVITEIKQYQLDGAGTSTEEKDKDTVILKLEGKPFDPLAQFLARMESSYAARPSRMTLKPAKGTGTVDAEITLER